MPLRMRIPALPPAALTGHPSLALTLISPAIMHGHRRLQVAACAPLRPSARIAAVRSLHAQTVQTPKIEPGDLPIVVTVMCIVAALVAVNVNYIISARKNSQPVVLTKADFLETRITSKTQVTDDTCIIRVAANPLRELAPDTGAFHVIVKDDSCQIARPYTPIDFSDSSLDLIVKRYDAGSVSRHIHSLQPGDIMHIRGPLQTFKHKPGSISHIGMVAGGTGIAPMYQFTRKVLADPLEARTKISIVYASRNAGSILLKKELDALQQEYPNRLHIKYLADTVLQGREPPSDVQIGLVSTDVLAQVLPQPKTDSNDHGPIAVLVCGPDGLVARVAGPKISENQPGSVGGMLKQIGYSTKQVLKL